MPQLLKCPTSQPWFGKYHFRFTTSRISGARVISEASFAALSEDAALETLNALLGTSRYSIQFMGFEEVPIEAWTPAQRLECGLDLKGRPRQATSAQPNAAPAGPKPKSRPAPLT